MNRLWREVGLLRDRQIVDLDVWAEYESQDGRRVTFWRDLDRLEAHLCELAPADADADPALIEDARRLAAADMPADLPPRELMSPWTCCAWAQDAALDRGRRGAGASSPSPQSWSASRPRSLMPRAPSGRPRSAPWPC